MIRFASLVGLIGIVLLVPDSGHARDGTQSHVGRTIKTFVDVPPLYPGQFEQYPEPPRPKRCTVNKDGSGYTLAPNLGPYGFDRDRSHDLSKEGRYFTTCLDLSEIAEVMARVMRKQGSHRLDADRIFAAIRKQKAVPGKDRQARYPSLVAIDTQPCPEELKIPDFEKIKDKSMTLFRKICGENPEFYRFITISDVDARPVFSREINKNVWDYTLESQNITVGSMFRPFSGFGYISADLVEWDTPEKVIISPLNGCNIHALLTDSFPFIAYCILYSNLEYPPDTRSYRYLASKDTQVLRVNPDWSDLSKFTNFVFNYAIYFPVRKDGK